MTILGALQPSVFGTSALVHRRLNAARERASLVVARCVFADSVVLAGADFGDGGGALAVLDDPALRAGADFRTTIAASEFRANDFVGASGAGGALLHVCSQVSAATSALVVDDCFFGHNRANQGPGFALCCAFSCVRLWTCSNCKRLHCNVALALYAGGAIATLEGVLFSQCDDVRIRRSRFVGNSARLLGGSLYIGSARNLSVADCELRDSSATEGGAFDAELECYSGC